MTFSAVSYLPPRFWHFGIFSLVLQYFCLILCIVKDTEKHVKCVKLKQPEYKKHILPPDFTWTMVGPKETKYFIKKFKKLNFNVQFDAKLIQSILILSVVVKIKKTFHSVRENPKLLILK